MATPNSLYFYFNWNLQARSVLSNKEENSDFEAQISELD